MGGHTGTSQVFQDGTAVQILSTRWRATLRNAPECTALGSVCASAVHKCLRRHLCRSWARSSPVQRVNSCFVHATSDVHAEFHPYRENFNKACEHHACLCSYHVLVRAHLCWAHSCPRVSVHAHIPCVSPRVLRAGRSLCWEQRRVNGGSSRRTDRPQQAHRQFSSPRIPRPHPSPSPWLLPLITSKSSTVHASVFLCCPNFHLRGFLRMNGLSLLFPADSCLQCSLCI